MLPFQGRVTNLINGKVVGIADAGSSVKLRVLRVHLQLQCPSIALKLAHTERSARACVRMQSAISDAGVLHSTEAGCRWSTARTGAHGL